MNPEDIYFGRELMSPDGPVRVVEIVRSKLIGFHCVCEPIAAPGCRRSYQASDLQVEHTSERGPGLPPGKLTSVDHEADGGDEEAAPERAKLLTPQRIGEIEGWNAGPRPTWYRWQDAEALMGEMASQIQDLLGHIKAMEQRIAELDAAYAILNAGVGEVELAQDWLLDRSHRIMHAATYLPCGGSQLREEVQYAGL